MNLSYNSIAAHQLDRTPLLGQIATTVADVSLILSFL